MLKRENANCTLFYRSEIWYPLIRTFVHRKCLAVWSVWLTHKIHRHRTLFLFHPGTTDKRKHSFRFCQWRLKFVMELWMGQESAHCFPHIHFYAENVLPVCVCDRSVRPSHFFFVYYFTSLISHTTFPYIEVTNRCELRVYVFQNQTHFASLL